jgi:hypothetical protein
MRPYEAERERRMTERAVSLVRTRQSYREIARGRRLEREMIQEAERESIRRGGAPVEEPLPWER